MVEKIYTMMNMGKRRVANRLFAVMTALLLLCLGNSAFGMSMGGGATCTSTISVMPGVDRLAPITSNLKSPTDVAIDADGRLYVTDLFNNSVDLFSQSGRYLSSLSGFAQPISVEVDRDGRIYVGNKQHGNVEVYDADFNFLHKLGAGDGEFSLPSDIEADLFGRIFVADTDNDMVKIFNADDGSPIGILGGSGTNDGEFYRPLSVAIDPVTQEIIVLDRNPGLWGEQEAKVQFFTINGIFVQSFKAFGSDTGQMTGPQRIVVDNQSRIYLSDSLLNTVVVYDNVGCYVGVVFEPVNHPRTPLGMAIGKNNKLYVTSHVTKSVEVYGLYESGSYGYMGMKIDPENLSFEVSEGGVAPEPVSISVVNTGNVLLNWSATTEDDWIRLSGLSFTNGIVEPGQQKQFKVVIDKTGLEPGVHKGNIIFTGDAGITEVVEVTLTIHSSPILSVAPISLSFVSEVGTTPAPQYFTVANAGSATLSWNAVANQPWISMKTAAGIITNAEFGIDKVITLADVTGLSAGTYTDSITVSGLNAFKSPALIEVTLTLVDPPGDAGGPTPEDRVFDEMAWTLGDKLPSATLNGVWTSSDSQVFAVGQGGTILHYNGTEWSITDSHTDIDLFGVWGSIDPDSNTVDVYAVGTGGTILHYDGIDWNVMASSGPDLKGVWGTSPIDVYAVGHDGIILHYNGANWSGMDSPTDKDINGIWGTSASDIYAVGERGLITSYDGMQWRVVKSSSKSDLYGVWGSSRSEIYAVGQDGTILKSGAKWSSVDSPTNRDLKSIWGTSASDIYAVGSAGTTIHYDGEGWSTMDTSTAKDLNSVWGRWETGVFAAGQDTTLLYYDGGSWQSLISSLEGLNSVWGRSASNVYAVGMLGSILHYDGYDWSAMNSPTTRTLNSVWGHSLTDIYAVGMGGTILKYNSMDWSTMVSPTNRTLYDVWGTSPTQMYAVGQRGTLLAYNGTSWASVKTKVKQDMYSIWGHSASDVYAVGQAGTILHYNGIEMSAMVSPTTHDLYSVRACSATSVFAVGRGGTFLQYNGFSWNLLESTTFSNLYDVWCSSETDVFIVGQDDTFLYYDGNNVQAVDFGTESSLRSVWGSTESTDIFAVGSDGIIIHGTNE